MTTPHQDQIGPSPRRTAPPSLLSLLAGAAARPGGREALAGAALGVGFLALIFRTNLSHLVLSWSTDANYSHGFLVPLISLYFANLAAARGPVPVRGGAVLGTALLAAGVLVKLATVIVIVGTLGDLALLVALAGLVALLAGTAALRRYGFAILFMVFMIPMPVALYTTIASPLQLMVSRLASVVLIVTGVPVLTEGNMMTLPGGVQMFVAEACSGMRQLTGFLALTAAVAYLARRPLWYRAGVVLSAVPIAMTANVARVVLTGYIMYYINPRYASGTYHTLEGLLMLGFGLSMLRLACWIFDQVIETEDGPGSPSATPAPHALRERRAGSAPHVVPVRGEAAVVLPATHVPAGG
jgi:exosortase